MPTIPACPYCNGARAHAGKGCPLRPRKRGARPPRPIMAIDCETVHDRIVLFLASGSDGRAQYLYDRNGLDFASIAQWLITLGANLCIGYFFDYDVQQIVRQMPASHLAQLWRNGRVIYETYRITHIPRKRFTITDLERNITTVIWDVSGWTQCSFVRLINDWKIGSEAERQFVKEMKDRRDDLYQVSESDLVRYTTLECSLLSKWFEQMLELHSKVGIHLTAYSGAGSTASAMLRKSKWKPPAVPDSVQAYAEQAFFGGRSEISRIGEYRGAVYGYDINSAYPHAITQLPEIRNVKWYRTRRYVEGAWGFYKVQWEQGKYECWGFFPLRGARLPEGRRSISLLFPVNGIGVYHSYEIDAVMRIAPHQIKILDGWITEPKGKPFDWVEETIAERLRLKNAGDPANIILKLGLNSLYGKMAQHTGTHPMQCMAYASAITAHTRSKMIPLLIENQHDILIVATDGILSAKPLSVPVSSALGEWEMSVYENAWILQAGVYWCGQKIRTRGIEQRQLDLESVKRLWARKKTEGELPVRVRRVISYRAACARNKPELTGTWVENSRIVRLSPEPRRRPWKWTEGALLTLPAPTAAYRAQAFADAIALEADAASLYDDDEALPDWFYD